MIRRDSSRQTTGFLIELRDPNGNIVGDATALNVSVGGVLVAQFAAEAKVEVRHGVVLGFSFHLPTGVVQGEGKVAWVDADNGRFGLQFAEEHQQGFENLLEFVNRSFVGNRDF